jgi:hypothetical protein
MDYDNKLGYLPLTVLAYQAMDDIKQEDLVVCLFNILFMK